MTVTWLVLDIDGTTSSAESVRARLYDYARSRLGAWIDAHPDDPQVQRAVEQVRAAGGALAGPPGGAAAGPAGGGGTVGVLAVLNRWIEGEVEATPLKTLQAQIWAAAFADGRLEAHFFPDVAPALRKWHAAGLRLAVFSAGSVPSQRCWFAHGPDGDLSALVERWFDAVNGGPKGERASYEKIAAALGEPPERLLFLSDAPDELRAAQAAGWRAVGVARPGEPNSSGYFGTTPTVTAFDQLIGLDKRKELKELALEAGARIAAQAARLAGHGGPHGPAWMPGASGSVSEVLNRGPLLAAMSASGRDMPATGTADVAVVDASGRPVAVAGIPAPLPSADAALHTRIAAVTGADAVIHVHALSAVLAGQRWPGGVVLRDLEMLKGLGRDAHDDEVRIPVIPNSQDMTELGDLFEQDHEPRTPVVIIAGHGLYAWGASLAGARHVTECADWLLSYALAAPGVTAATTAGLIPGPRR